MHSVALWFLALVLAAVIVGGIYLARAKSRPASAAGGNNALTGTPFVPTLPPDAEGLELIVAGHPSIRAGSIRVRGRFQIFVRQGSQFATWFPFPNELYFHILKNPDGERGEPPHFPTRNVSATRETYDYYASLPADKVVGRDFDLDLIQGFGLAKYFQKPGDYVLEVEYLGIRSKLYSFTLKP